MKKAFDQNVSRAKPRLRLGASFTAPAEEETATVEAPPEPLEEKALATPAPTDPAEELKTEVKARVERSREPAPSATEALERALSESARPPAPATAAAVEVQAVAVRPAVEHRPVARAAPEPLVAKAPPPAAPVAKAPPPPAQVMTAQSMTERREKLRERLKAARENPRPEPLPATVAQAGVLAVERIATLQTELHRVKTLNLALTQDLESARRQAERATEEARLRMEEAQRLASEMEGRVTLLKDLERELSAIESERDEALLALTDSRQSLHAGAKERAEMESELAKRDQSLAESLAEEERLAGELESARDESRALRSTVDALGQERNTLARQVADLTSERAELLEARKALEAVHRALSHAATR